VQLQYQILLQGKRKMLLILPGSCPATYSQVGGLLVQELSSTHYCVMYKLFPGHFGDIIILYLTNIVQTYNFGTFSYCGPFLYIYYIFALLVLFDDRQLLLLLFCFYFPISALVILVPYD